MRCSKCGFISFDYLSECRKCGVDLTAARDRLKLPGGKPSIPSLLGSLLKGSVAPTRETVKEMAPSEPAASEFSEIELEGFDFDEDLEIPDEEPTQAAAAFPGETVMKDHLDSALKILQDIEGPDHPSADAGPGTDIELEIDSVLDAALVPAAEGEPVNEVSSPKEMDENAGIELSFDDLGLPVGDAEAGKAADITMDFQTKPEDIPAGAAGAPTPGTEAVGSTVQEDVVVELSDADLENLMLELDESSGVADKKPENTPEGAGRPDRKPKE